MQINAKQNETNSINYLEHVVVAMSLTINTTGGSVYGYDDFFGYDDGDTDRDDWLKDSHPRQGDINIQLLSPHGTKSVLLPYRDYDFINEEGYDNWPFMSVHYWGENPVGTWYLYIAFNSPNGSVKVDNVTMILYGANSIAFLNGECDSSCVRGCSGPDPQDCDVCGELRNASNLECVSYCPNNTVEYGGYCIEGKVIYPAEYESGDHALAVGLSIAAALLTLGIVVTIIVIVVCVLVIQRKRKYAGRVEVPVYSELL